MNSKISGSAVQFGMGFAIVLLLGGVLGAMSADQLFTGGTPSGSGQVACATGATSAAWENTNACFNPGLRVGSAGASTANPALFGFFDGATASRIFWDTFTYGQFTNGGRLQFANYHGISIYGARGSNASLPFETGGGSSDWGLEVHSGGVNGLLVDNNAQINGSLQVGSGGQDITSINGISKVLPANATWNFTIGAQSCVNPTFTLSGATTGSVCSMSAGSTAGATANLTWGCLVSATNTVLTHICNVTGASITFNANYRYLVFNP